MGKRILKIPKHYAKLLPRVSLQLPSMKVQRYSSRNYISWLISLPAMMIHLDRPHSGLWPCVMWIIIISLVQQCRWLERHQGSITDRCLQHPEEAESIVHEATYDLLKKDKHLTLLKASNHQSLKHVLNIEYWLHVWDRALDKGRVGMVAIQKLIQYLAIPGLTTDVNTVPGVLNQMLLMLNI